MSRSLLLCLLLLAGFAAASGAKLSAFDHVEDLDGDHEDGREDDRENSQGVGVVDALAISMTYNMATASSVKDNATELIAARHGQSGAWRSFLEASSDHRCPELWSYHGGSCYMIPSLTASWHEANQLCHQYDRRANLISIYHDNVDHVNQLVRLSGHVYVWIGLARVGDIFGWVDGSPLDYISWVPGEPNDAQHGEHCTHMYGGDHDVPHRLNWNDNACSRFYNFLCQITLASE